MFRRALNIFSTHRLDLCTLPQLAIPDAALDASERSTRHQPRIGAGKPGKDARTLIRRVPGLLSPAPPRCLRREAAIPAPARRLCSCTAGERDICRTMLSYSQPIRLHRVRHGVAHARCWPGLADCPRLIDYQPVLARVGDPQEALEQLPQRAPGQLQALRIGKQGTGRRRANSTLSHFSRFMTGPVVRH